MYFEYISKLNLFPQKSKIMTDFYKNPAKNPDRKQAATLHPGEYGFRAGIRH